MFALAFGIFILLSGYAFKNVGYNIRQAWRLDNEERNKWNEDRMWVYAGNSLASHREACVAAGLTLLLFLNRLEIKCRRWYAEQKRLLLSYHRSLNKAAVKVYYGQWWQHTFGRLRSVLYRIADLQEVVSRGWTLSAV